ncbi:alpha/beta fold hydrolase [Actinomyces gaoshouyii]|uniref:AB hydrolase-1 domain-containing protein n=1 Tax=Actinomyces gaoshouyii TaxID=1960083 RepID=A0A8H9H6D5_9ACTO|nr:alpha/beta hydrolase [Actinomyces gaoshouyii]GGO94672.1 hypothetical protein GCM10011612_00650 [Actinomyces gaoshouyii]
MTDAQRRWEGRIAEHAVHRRPGSGPAVLFLNGCGMASVAWETVVKALPGRAIIAVDRPGRCGGSVNEGAPDLLSGTRILARIIDGDEPVIIVAHSMSSFQAEALARLRPDAVAGIVLADPAVEVGVRIGHLRRAAAKALAGAVGAALRLDPLRGAAAAVVRFGMRRETSHPEAVDDPLWRACHETREALSAAAAELASYSAQAADLTALRDERGGPVAAPVIVLEGMPFHSGYQEQALDTVFSRLEIRRLPQSRHLMMLDAPEAIVRAINDLSEGAVPAP